MDDIGVNETTKKSHGSRTRKHYHGNGGSADGNHPTAFVNCYRITPKLLVKGNDVIK